MRNGKEDAQKENITITCPKGHVVDDTEVYGDYYFCEKCGKTHDRTLNNHQCMALNSFREKIEIFHKLYALDGNDKLFGTWDISFCPLCGIFLE